MREINPNLLDRKHPFGNQATLRFRHSPKLEPCPLQKVCTLDINFERDVFTLIRITLPKWHNGF